MEIENKETLAQKALRLLSEVPADDFITGAFTDEVGKCCAVGHYKRLTSENPSDYSRKNCDDYYVDYGIRELSNDFIKNKHNMEYGDISSVNNRTTVNGYNEPVIKDRVIHLLKDMVNDGL